MTLWACIDCGQRFKETDFEKNSEFGIFLYFRIRKIIGG